MTEEMIEKMKILVVDDERLNINVLVELLKPNYKMMAAINGQQAIKAANSASPPDLILLDIMMPEMDGYEVCAQLKSDPNTKDIPIIFVTAMGKEESETKGLDLGAADYLPKPISPAIVEARVRTQLALKKNHEELKNAYRLIETQKKRMQTELDVGRDIQLAMVPKIFPSNAVFDIHARLEPAREVGGDFYDVFSIDEEHICLCVGDVSGKGVPAALFMAMAKTLIKSRATTDSSTASIVTHVNDELSIDNDGCLFVTLYVCILNTQTGVLLTTNAGHNPPLIRTATGEIKALKRLDGPVVAALEEFAYKEGTFQLNNGDSLLMFTDGVTEADTEDGQFFGDPRLEKLFAERTTGKAEDFVAEIFNQVHQFEGENRQADDITVLVMDYFGTEDSDTETSIELKLINELSEIESITDSLMSFTNGHNIPSRITGTICMGLDDLLTNVISYAYNDDKQHEINVKISLIDKSIVTVISDDGMPFNPFQQVSPDVKASIEEREIGGLGVHLVKKMFDKVSYHRNIDKNVVTLIKLMNQD
jgi:sigma-B regulation protein RsbU (phosphoserine phosphatase)